MQIARSIDHVAAGEDVALIVDPRQFNRHQIRSFVDFGTHTHTTTTLDSEQIDARFSEVREWLRFVSDSDRMNAVYMDTTTLVTVDTLILKGANHYLCPSTLLDIASFVNATVLYDRIFHLENSHIDSLRFNESLGEPVVIELPVSKFAGGRHGDEVHSLGSILRGLWFDTEAQVHRVLNDTLSDSVYAEGFSKLKAAWATLLEVKIDDGRLRQSHRRVESRCWDTDGPGLLEQLVEAHSLANIALSAHLDDPHTEQLIYDLISECNYRSLFNQRVGYLLGLSYLPNSHRMPFREHLYEEARAVHHRLLTLDLIDAEYKKRIENYFAPDRNNLILPFFMAALINKIGSLDEFFEALAEMRYKASTFRSRRADLEQALRQGDVREAERLTRALRSESNTLRLTFPIVTCGAIAAVLANLAAATSPVILAAIALLTFAAQFPHDDIQRLKERALAPQLWFLADMKDLALELGNAYPKISRLWSLGDSHHRAYARQINQISRLRR